MLTRIAAHRQRSALGRRDLPASQRSRPDQRDAQLAKQGAPGLRWALVEAAQHASRKNSPDHELYRRQHGHAGANPATLTVARKIGKRAFHVLRALDAQTPA